MAFFDNPVIQQVGNNLVILLIAVFIIGFLQRGFFFPFLKVKVSFGKYILAKVRAVNRDYYKTGWIDEGFLVYKTKDGKKRIAIPDSSVFYRSLGVTWVDIDEKTNNLLKPDYTVMSGYDAQMYDSLLKRALYRPTEADQKFKIFMILLIVAILVGVASGYISFLGYRLDQQILGNIAEIKNGIVIPR
jgi:hypothetical protein